jgi:hypothetical protein
MRSVNARGSTTHHLRVYHVSLIELTAYLHLHCFSGLLAYKCDAHLDWAWLCWDCPKPGNGGLQCINGECNRG